MLSRATTLLSRPSAYSSCGLDGTDSTAQPQRIYYYADYYRISEYTMIGNHAFFYRWVTKDSADAAVVQQKEESSAPEENAQPESESSEGGDNSEGENQEDGGSEEEGENDEGEDGGDEENSE